MMEINAIPEKEPRRLLVKPVEAAAMLSCSKSKIYELIKSGAIPSVTLADGKMLRIPLAALMRLAAATE